MASIALATTRSNISMTIGALLQELYEGESQRAVRYALLLFDVLTIVFLVVTSFVEGGPVLELIDATIGLVIPHRQTWIQHCLHITL